MAEEKDALNQEPNTSTQTEDRAAAIAAARALLLEEGAQVFTPQDMHGFKSGLTDPLKAKLSERESELEALRAEREAFAREKAERENAGKTRAEIIEAQLKAAQADIERERAERAAIAKAMEDRETVYRNERRDSILQTILADVNGPRPVDAEAALLKAKANLAGLTVNESRELVWTEPNGVPHTGPAAEKIVRDWWAKQTSLHAAGPAGPDTGGAPKAPTPKADVYVSDPNEDLDTRLAKARAFMARNR